MNVFKLVFVMGSVLLASCASDVRVSSDHQPGTDFSEYKAYRWQVANEANNSSKQYLANDILDGRIRTAVESTLKAKGFESSVADAVDFHVNYSVTTQDKIDVRSYNTYDGYGPGFGYGAYYGRGYRHGGIGYGFSTGVDTHVSQYKEGTLVLDVIDAKSNKLVWRGSAEGRLHKKKTPQERTERLNEAIAKLLESFPPES